VAARSRDPDAQYVQSATDRLTHPARDDGPKQMRVRRVSYLVGTILFTAIVATAVTDRLGWTEATGVSAHTASAAHDGYDLEVRYPAVTRPAVASPFDIRVEHDGGFDEPIQIAVSWPWLEMWDENSWYPAPSSAYGDDGQYVMEFDPPPGDVLRVIYDARIQPTQQSGRDGFVSVLEDDIAVVTVPFHTRVMP
jgi:hypothetical protein